MKIPHGQDKPLTMVYLWLGD